ncbi:MAG: tetratricopeptide repeat protein [Acidobacteriaceae bacterium]|nr:tetratricopeptide repeat protein [Acidobacteriaceae bacterium]
MRLCRAALVVLGLFCYCVPAFTASVLVIPFHNNSQYPDLEWVGESISETLKSELGALNEIVFDRDAVAKGFSQLSLKPGATFTKATLIRLGQTLDADYICYGTYNATLSPDDAQLKNSSVQVTSRFIDLRKLHDGPSVTEAGKLSDLSRLEQHLAWEALKYLQPGQNLSFEQFMAPGKLVRLEAEESYIRGLLSTNKDQQEKWFAQAVVLDRHFTNPAFELGNLYLSQKDYRQALRWFGEIPAADRRYPEARFKMGVAAFGAGDYESAAKIFREVSKSFPMNEVFNNLGAAENELGLPVAIDDFRHALDGDPNNTTYLFNLGLALLRNNSFDEAIKRLQVVVDRRPQDAEARQLLNRAKARQTSLPGGKPLAPERLATSFDATAYRQLKAMLQPHGNGS